MAGFKLVAIFLLFTSQHTYAARILGVFPWPGSSHMITFSALTRELAERGHELVVLSTFPSKNPTANYTDIDTSSALKELYEAMLQNKDIYDFEDTPKVLLPLVFYWKEGIRTTDLTLQLSKVKNLLNDKRGFDLVIAEDFMCDAFFAFSHHFKAPLILMSSFGGFHTSNYAVGNPYNTAHVPNNILEYSDRKTFYERLVNTLFTWYWDIGNEVYFSRVQNQMKDVFFGPGYPSVQELRKSASLVLVNQHFSLNYPRPLVPAFVEVGGMHVKPVTKSTMPKEMKKWLDDAKDGVIYFSMGSNLRAEFMPETARNNFLAAFGTLKQKVIWKWETDTLPGKPDNVMLTKWAPQMEILSHPNVKLFITHGGLLSGQEAMYNGVPVVGIPIFGDQRMNVERAVNEGYGVMLSIKNITKEAALTAINIGLHDKGIREEVKRRQKVYLDQPQQPLERAVFWTEYVLRHKGAPHMRSAALDLAWYQVQLLDVYAFLASIILLSSFLTCKVISLLCCRRNKQLTGSRKKKTN